MSKSTNAARSALAKKLANIAAKREKCRKDFEAKLEKMWADHRAKMAQLRADRKAAYESYESGVTQPKVKKARSKKSEVKIEAELIEQPVEQAVAEQPAEVAAVAE